MRNLAIFLAGICIVAAWSFGWPAYRNYQGYCADLGRRLDKVELQAAMKMAAFELFKADVRRVKRETGTPEKLTDIETQETFFARHVDCCELVDPESLRAEEAIAAYPRMRGDFLSWVRLEIYMVDVRGTEHLQSRKRAINNCGQLSSYPY
ncbi:MAG: hypothetical protein ABJN34_03475 [Litoreibacter sp.]|uniref:hypothetical protein n=1 Tax=Litoreibacter sp. TaxID=1969459 RepID=UPI00329714A5